MKPTFLFLVFFSITLLASAQQKLEVEIGEKSMSKGPQMAVTVLIPEAKSKDVEPVWKKYVNNRSFGERIGNLATQIGNIFKSEENQVSRDKLKVEKNGDELYVRSIEEASLSKHSMDIYARMTELPNGCQFSAFFQYTDSVFINEKNVDQDRIENMKSYIRNFGIIVYKNVVDDQIIAAKKNVTNEEKTVKDIQSASKKQEKAIAGFETDIKEYNAGIVEVENDIKRMEEVINTQKMSIETLTKKTPEYDIAKKGLKDLEKEKSKYFNKIKSFKKKIKSREADINAAKGKITQNDIQLNKQQLVIQDKQKIVEQLVAKKEAIQ
jgi:hypothetical protein